MEKGKVSVITPTYNHEKFLASCLDSVITQSYSNWEVIIIDDGSTDKTGAIGRSYAKQYQNILYIHQKNIGPYRLAESYNKALAAATGEYIAILEGDDFWYPEKLELQVARLKNEPKAVLSWGRARSVHAENLQVIREHPTLEKDRNLFNNEPVGSILQLMYVDNCIPALTILMKNKTLQQIGGFQMLPNLPLVDYPTLLELSTLGSFAYVNEFLGAWRIYPHQVTKTHTVDIKRGLHQYARFHYNKNREKGEPALQQIQWPKIEAEFIDQRIISHARAGRYKLIHKDFRGARKDYISALKTGGLKQPTWKMRAIVGWMFSWLKLDVEKLARLLSKTSYK